MRRVGIVIFVILCGVLASCMPIESVGRTIGLVKQKSFEIPKGPDGIWFDVAPLIVPVGDRYANDGIWTETDEQILPAATRLKLQENGLRVGLIVSGRTPDGLQRLLGSPKSNAPNGPNSARRHIKPEPTATKTQLLAEFPRLEIPLRLDDQTQTKSFENAKCQFEILPSLDGDTKVRLVFTPQIEFDDKEKWKRLNSGVALAVQGQRSTENFVPLQFDVSLGPNDFVVIGGRLDKQETLGFKLFINPDSQQPAQRLMVVRAGRFKPGKPAEIPKSSLAAQAATK